MAMLRSTGRLIHRRSVSKAVVIALTAALTSGCEQLTATGSHQISTAHPEQAGEQDAQHWKRRCCHRAGRNNNH